MLAGLLSLGLLIVSACSEETWTPPTGPAHRPPPAQREWKDLGEYTVTMTASPSCSLPDYAMTRSYDARLGEIGQDLLATFADQRFIAWAGPAGFSGTKDGETVRFYINGDYFVDGYSFVYLVKPGEELAYTGTATGTMQDARIVARLDGTVLLRSYDDLTVLAQCDASDHRMELVRK
jgi:hypothetical protein